MKIVVDVYNNSTMNRDSVMDHDSVPADGQREKAEGQREKAVGQHEKAEGRREKAELHKRPDGDPVHTWVPLPHRRWQSFNDLLGENGVNNKWIISDKHTIILDIIHTALKACVTPTIDTRGMVHTPALRVQRCCHVEIWTPAQLADWGVYISDAVIDGVTMYRFYSFADILGVDE